MICISGYSIFHVCQVYAVCRSALINEYNNNNNLGAQNQQPSSVFQNLSTLKMLQIRPHTTAIFRCKPRLAVCLLIIQQGVLARSFIGRMTFLTPTSRKHWAAPFLHALRLLDWKGRHSLLLRLSDTVASLILRLFFVKTKHVSKLNNNH